MTKRKRKEDKREIEISETEYNELIQLKSWQLSNKIESTAFEEAFTTKEKQLEYLHLHLNFLTEKLNQFDKFQMKHFPKRAKSVAFKRWQNEVFRKQRDITGFTINKIRTLIRNIEDDDSDNSDEEQTNEIENISTT